MVGIGGGVPRENLNVRLGVVSQPDGTLSGFIQYGYGDTLHSGRFHRIGTLNKPPLVLFKAIT
jgi:hypothetical protein